MHSSYPLPRHHGNKNIFQRRRDFANAGHAEFQLLADRTDLPFRIAQDPSRSGAACCRAWRLPRCPASFRGHRSSGTSIPRPVRAVARGKCVAPQIGRRARSDNLSGIDKRQPVAVFGLVHVVRRNKDGDGCLRELVDQLPKRRGATRDPHQRSAHRERQCAADARQRRPAPHAAARPAESDEQMESITSFSLQTRIAQSRSVAP